MRTVEVRQVHGHGHEEALHVVVRQEALTSGLLPANVGKTQRRGVASVWAELRNTCTCTYVNILEAKRRRTKTP